MLTKWRCNMNDPKILTVEQLAGEFTAFQVSTIRWWIYNSARNGFDVCIIRIGSRVYVDRARFLEWVESHRPVEDNVLIEE